MEVVLSGKRLSSFTYTDLLGSVKSLDLSKNEFTEISHVFKKLKRLEKLDISENQVSSRFVDRSNLSIIVGAIFSFF